MKDLNVYLVYVPSKLNESDTLTRQERIEDMQKVYNDNKIKWVVIMIYMISKLNITESLNVYFAFVT